MDWIEEVREKQKRKNRILFSKDSVLLFELANLLETVNRRVVFLWVISLAEESAAVLEQKYLNEHRFSETITAARLWANGTIKMPAAKEKILYCHGFAKEISDPVDIALSHAIGQACSVVHTPKHALGYPIYELTSLVLRDGIQYCKETVENRTAEYTLRLLNAKQMEPNLNFSWADFMKK